MGLGKFLSGLFSGETPADAKQAGEAGHIKTGEATSRENTAPAAPGAPHEEAQLQANAAAAPSSLEAMASDAPPSEPPQVTEEKVLEILSNVYDPEIPIDIVNLGLIYGIEIDGGNVRIEMTMTAPGCPASTQIAGESRLLVEEIPGVESVDIELVWDPPWDPSKMSEEAQQSLNF